MVDMTNTTTFESTDFNLDRQIEELVGKKVRGEIERDDTILLTRLVARRAREMRPRRGRGAIRRLAACG
jgi:hypothetical protein